MRASGIIHLPPVSMATKPIRALARIHGLMHVSSTDIRTLLRALRLAGTVMVTSKTAFRIGSSQHGKQRLATVASNWVDAMTRLTPA